MRRASGKDSGLRLDHLPLGGDTPSLDSSGGGDRYLTVSPGSDTSGRKGAHGPQEVRRWPGGLPANLAPRALCSHPVCPAHPGCPVHSEMASNVPSHSQTRLCAPLLTCTKHLTYSKSLRRPGDSLPHMCPPPPSLIWLLVPSLTDQDSPKMHHLGHHRGALTPSGPGLRVPASNNAPWIEPAASQSGKWS